MSDAVSRTIVYSFLWDNPWDVPSTCDGGWHRYQRRSAHQPNSISSFDSSSTTAITATYLGSPYTSLDIITHHYSPLYRLRVQQKYFSRLHRRLKLPIIISHLPFFIIHTRITTVEKSLCNAADPEHQQDQKPAKEVSKAHHNNSYNNSTHCQSRDTKNSLLKYQKHLQIALWKSLFFFFDSRGHMTSPVDHTRQGTSQGTCQSRWPSG